MMMTIKSEFSILITVKLLMVVHYNNFVSLLNAHFEMQSMVTCLVL